MTSEHLADVEATLAFGRRLAANVERGSCLALVGNLGAGKTHITQGIVAGLGCETEVTSPTFSLVQEYTGGSLPVYHFDFYRLDEVRELEGIGWDDYLGAGGVIIVEWADLFPEALPGNTQWVKMEHAEGGGRNVTHPF